MRWSAGHVRIRQEDGFVALPALDPDESAWDC